MRNEDILAVNARQLRENFVEYENKDLLANILKYIHGISKRATSTTIRLSDFSIKITDKDIEYLHKELSNRGFAVESSGANSFYIMTIDWEYSYKFENKNGDEKPMKEFNAREIQKILINYCLEQGESPFEYGIDSDFDGQENDYLEWLTEKGYLSETQAQRWTYNRSVYYQKDFLSDEYTSIETMTYITEEEYPHKLMEIHDCIREDFSLNVYKAKELGLINTPLLLRSSDVDEFNNFYYNEVFLIISQYIYSRYDLFKDSVNELYETVAHYLKEEDVKKWSQV